MHPDPAAALDKAIEKGVPREAAEAFMAGHAQIAMAITFGAEKSPFSDAAQVAIRWKPCAGSVSCR